MNNSNGEQEYIYAIICKKNNKIYIGKTSRDVQTRKYEHIQEIFREKHIKELQQDYEQFGEDAFLFVTLLKTKTADLCEPILIEIFSRKGQVYNKKEGLGFPYLMGTVKIPRTVYEEIESILSRLCTLLSLDVGEMLSIFDSVKNQLDQPLMEIKKRDVSSIECDFSYNLYNFEYKRFYLGKSNYRMNTKETILKRFRKISEFEIKNEKDLYNFTFNEAEEVLYSLHCKTLRSLQNYTTMLGKYLGFSIAQGVSINDSNYYQNLATKENGEKYLLSEAQDEIIFEKEEIMLMAKKAVNVQDGVILALIFEGVSHKNEFEELINLTEDDINFENNTIRLKNRTISISNETALLIKGALNLDTPYYSTKGDNVRKYKITQGKYVLRGVRNKLKVKANVISERIIRLSEYYDYKYLNATSLTYSGQIYFAIDLMNNQNMTLDETLPLVLKRFGNADNPNSRFYLKSRIQKYLEERN